MAFHEKYRRDSKGDVIKDKDSNPIADREGIDYNKFPKNFLADTKEESDRLYKIYLNTLQLLATKYSRLTGLNSEDFIQEGIIGLARASRDFASERSKDFNTFAIYKIKDSMREFVSSQSAAIKIPQYIRDAVNLIEKLKKLVSTIEHINNLSTLNIWRMSEKYEKPGNTIESIISTRNSISNLAERSCTSVNQLIERVELMPTNMEYIDIDSHIIDHKLNEESVVGKIISKESVKRIKNMLSEDDYKLIVSHFVDGKTVRELAEETKLKASSVTVKIHNIVSKLGKKEGVILNADNKDIEKIREGNSS